MVVISWQWGPNCGHTPPPLFKPLNIIVCDMCVISAGFNLGGGALHLAPYDAERRYFLASRCALPTISQGPVLMPIQTGNILHQSAFREACVFSLWGKHISRDMSPRGSRGGVHHCPERHPSLPRADGSRDRSFLWRSSAAKVCELSQVVCNI